MHHSESFAMTEKMIETATETAGASAVPEEDRHIQDRGPDRHHVEWIEIARQMIGAGENGALLPMMSADIQTNAEESTQGRTSCERDFQNVPPGDDDVNAHELL